MRNSFRLVAALAVAVLLGVGGASAASATDAPAPAGHAQSSAVLAPAVSAFDGTWVMTQSNGDVVTLFNGIADGLGNFAGVAETSTATGASGGQVTGSVVLFNINWSYGHTGRYVGHLGSNGQWSGTTIDLNNPSSTATWTASRA